jgi:hypothetical protein
MRWVSFWLPSSRPLRIKTISGRPRRIVPRRKKSEEAKRHSEDAVKIVELSAHHVKIPLRRPIRHASHRRTEPDNVVEDIRGRVGRLEELSRGLARERVLWEEAADPLLYLERKAYLQAIREAISGVEAARVVLVKACQRIEAEEPSCEGRQTA